MTWDRRLSLIISSIYLVVAISQDIRWPVLFAFLMVTLACIWYGDELGDYIGPAGRYGYIDRPTPGIFIRIFGWVLLFLPLVLWLYSHWHSDSRRL